MHVVRWQIEKTVLEPVLVVETYVVVTTASPSSVVAGASSAFVVVVPGTFGVGAR